MTGLVDQVPTRHEMERHVTAVSAYLALEVTRDEFCRCQRIMPYRAACGRYFLV
jgi:hypothetical protein